MCNAQGALDHGCMMFLIDECALHLNVLGVIVLNHSWFTQRLRHISTSFENIQGAPRIYDWRFSNVQHHVP